MEHSADEGSLRVGSDRGLRLECHGTRIASDAGLPVCPTLYDAPEAVHHARRRAIGYDR